MKNLILSKEDILQFQYILPVQGSLKTLELVENIIDKAKIEKNNDENKTISFEDEELRLMIDSIHFLDSQQKINFQSLSLIRKILNI